MEIIFGIISQKFPSLRYIGIGVLDIALAVRAIDRLDILAEGIDKGLVDIIEILTTAISDIEGLAGSLMRSQASFQIGFDNILDIGEVAALLAVTVDSRALVIQEHLDELGDDGGIGAMRVLPPAEDIEVSQAVSIEAIMHRVHLCPLLVAALGKSVRAEEISFNAFFLGKMRLVAIDRAGRGINELLDAVLASSLQHIQRTLDIILAVEQWHLDGARNTAPGCLIEDIIYALTRFHTSIKVLDITLDELIVRVIGEEIYIGLLARRQIVQAADLIAQVKNRLAQVGTDEAGAAGDEEEGIFREG